MTTGSTISTPIYNGITLGTAASTGTYTSPLTITGSGGVTASSGDAIYGPGSQAWTLGNQGTVAATGGSGVGVDLKAGGSVDNTGTGLIKGYVDGVKISGSAGTITNSATIAGSGPFSNGVYLGLGGSVDNTGTGLIEGSVNGVKISGGAGTVSNCGTIHGTNSIGIYLVAGGRIVNSGTILAPNSTFAVVVVGGGYLTNSGSGYIGAGGILFENAAGTVVNDGRIVDSAAGLKGVALYTGGTLTNSGTISATGSGATGVYIYGGGSVYNLSSGLIDGGLYGVKISGGAGTVTNYGTIDPPGPGGVGVFLEAGGSVFNASSGLIEAELDPVDQSFGPGTVTNLGTMLGTGTAAVGIRLAAGGTVIESGTISGGSGTAVSFGGTSDNLLVLNPGFQLNGVVVASTSAGATNTLELGSAASAGTLSGLGTSFVNFGTVTDDAGAQWVLSGDNTIGGTFSIFSPMSVAHGRFNFDSGTIDLVVADSGIEVLSDATLVGTGVIMGPGTVSGSGIVEASGGRLQIESPVGPGVTGLQIADGDLNVLELANEVDTADFVTFQGGAGVLDIESSPGTFAGTIALNAGSDTVLASNDLIQLGSFTVNSAALSGTSLTVDTTGGTFNLTLSAPHPGAFADWSGSDVFLSTVACFCRGTLIWTERGEVAVEDLAIGDEVVILSGEARPIKWIGHRAYEGRFVAANRAVLPIRIEAGALGDGVPARDLLVSPEHALYIDGVLVPAGLLANGATIRQVENIDRLEYFHIELAMHDVILAEGAPAETFVDCDNRFMFQNGDEFAALYPDDTPEPWKFCAVRVEPGSAELATVRTALLGRAEALGYGLSDGPRSPPDHRWGDCPGASGRRGGLQLHDPGRQRRDMARLAQRGPGGGGSRIAGSAPAWRSGQADRAARR